MTRQVDGNHMAITGCMKENLIVLKPKKNIFCKAYLCDCTSCLQFDFEDCSNKNAVDNGEDDTDLEEIDQTEQIFDFIIVPPFLSLFSGSTIEPLYFVQITGKGIVNEEISDPYKHCLESMPYFQGLYFKAVRSKNSRIKKFSTIPTRMTPDEIYDTYVNFNDNLELDVNTYNMLIRKANC